jgi:hypothetical protein
LIGSIVAIVGLLIAVLAASSAESGYGVAATSNANSAATAGVEDALLQLDRNFSFSNTSGYTVSSASSTTATVTVTQNAPVAGQAAILSVATVQGHTQKISVVVAENSATGQISVVSWKEVQ